MRLFANAHTLELRHGQFLGGVGRHSCDLDGCQRQVVQNAQVGKQVELLKHHAHFLANLVDHFQVWARSVSAQFVPIHDQAAALKPFQGVDAANQGRFA